MTTKLTTVIPLNSLKMEKKIKPIYSTNSTLPGFHHLQEFHGTQVWFVFDNKAPRDIFIEL
ncbi:hypothetical protein SAMN06298216_3216 [Spirosomataceae bacterium TFI 002]|nr:hypothetical protein SAMN06298216_3216 [Spirosomataceae bacterium TFI 002]